MKIVSAVNAMIASPKLITNVVPAIEGTEIYFKFMDKHKWSINKIDQGYNLFYYAIDVPIENLANWDEEDWQRTNGFVRYSTKELGSREAVESFAELYRIVQERQFGVEDVLDEIIGNADWLT